MNVFDHFKTAFPYHHLDADEVRDLTMMTLDSPCGKECQTAIDAAKVFEVCVKNAFADDFDYAHKVREICLRTVLCYICG